MEGSAVMERAEKASLTTRYIGQDSRDFLNFIEERWEAAERVKNFVKGEVESNVLEPLEAGKILACSLGQLFGYQEFHSDTSTDVSQALLSRLPQE